MAEPNRVAGGLCWDSDPARAGMVLDGADSPDLALAKRLLDDVKLRGFQFWRAAPGEDGPLVGHRVSSDCVDLIHIEGFSRDCFAWRKRTSSLIVPGAGLVERQVNGSALTVLNEVLTWEPNRESRDTSQLVPHAQPMMNKE